MRIAEKWDGRMPGVGADGGTWKERARRAEAEAAATRGLSVSTQLKSDARALQHERDLQEITGSIGWRLTEPLRRVNALRRRARRRRA
jgi:hypothetical protein